MCVIVHRGHLGEQLFFCNQELLQLVVEDVELLTRIDGAGHDR
jgi:hypothetical protein